VCVVPNTTCRMHAHPGWSDRPGGSASALRSCVARRLLCVRVLLLAACDGVRRRWVCCTLQRPAEVEAPRDGAGLAASRATAHYAQPTPIPGSRPVVGWAPRPQACQSGTERHSLPRQMSPMEGSVRGPVSSADRQIWREHAPAARPFQPLLSPDRSGLVGIEKQSLCAGVVEAGFEEHQVPEVA
jgi:hypothetical protein